MESTPPVPLEATLRFTVTDDDTAVALGSGDLAVLATPRLLAWCEAACCEALQPSLAEGDTSVGSRVSLQHSAPSPVGRVVEVTASVLSLDGRLHRFTVSARHVDGVDEVDGEDGERAGAVVAGGELTRVVVDRERFLARLGS